MKRLIAFAENHKKLVWTFMMVILTSGTVMTIYEGEDRQADLRSVVKMYTDSLPEPMLMKGERGISGLMEAIQQKEDAEKIMRHDTIAEEDLQLMKNIDQAINQLIHESH